MKKTLVIKVLLLSSLFLFFPTAGVPMVHAQNSSEIVIDKQTVVKAEVLEILKSEVKMIPGTDTPHNNQKIKVKILEGLEKNKEVTVDNDYLELKRGEIFYLMHTKSDLDGVDYYSVEDPYRIPQLMVLVVLFLLAVLFFGGIQGVRGILSLVGSLLLIVYVLLPGILNGISPLLITIGVSSLIIIVGSYITHGFNKTTSSAVLGMIVTVSITGLLAFWAVSFTRLSGFNTEEVLYLNLNSRGSIDVVALLLGGIMIGLLGVLYDIAIGQAISVEELIRIAPHVEKKIIYKRAIRIGREHIGALVNTLAIAYVGVSLPLLLLFTQASTDSIWIVMNREIFSTEIVRTMVGSIGLVIATPITTMVSMWVLTRKNNKKIDQSIIEEEKHALEHVGHGHSH
jgi:uncharacterized membrane protein